MNIPVARNFSVNESAVRAVIVFSELAEFVRVWVNDSAA